MSTGGVDGETDGDAEGESEGDADGDVVLTTPDIAQLKPPESMLPMKADDNAELSVFA